VHGGVGQLREAGEGQAFGMGGAFPQDAVVLPVPAPNTILGTPAEGSPLLSFCPAPVVIVNLKVTPGAGRIRLHESLSSLTLAWRWRPAWAVSGPDNPLPRSLDPLGSWCLARCVRRFFE
jgi:hypothetical protein